MVPQSEIETVSPALEAWSLNHLTTTGNPRVRVLSHMPGSPVSSLASGGEAPKAFGFEGQQGLIAGMP